MKTIKKIITFLYIVFYWKICNRLHSIMQKKFSYAHYIHVFEKVCKVKDVKTNVLTKEQKIKIDDFYRKYYGKKVTYMWHNFITSFNDKFDVKYLTPTAFVELRNKLNLNFDSILYDKNFLYNFIGLAKVKVPKRLFYSIKNLFFDSSDNIISKEDLYNKLSNMGETFIKPSNLRSSGYAKNCRLINVINGIDIYSKKNIKDLIESNYPQDFIIQEKIVCHKSISDIYSKSVNTFSIYTFIWNGEVKVLNKPVLKIGMNDATTDYSGIEKEGLIIAMDSEGYLSEFALNINKNKWYSSHPNTGLVFKNHKIENLKKVFESAKKLHSCVPWLGFCRWDITINLDGEPVLIETEPPGELFQQQILYKEGFFGDYTEEILTFLKNNDRR